MISVEYVRGLIESGKSLDEIKSDSKVRSIFTEGVAKEIALAFSVLKEKFGEDFGPGFRFVEKHKGADIKFLVKRNTNAKNVFVEGSPQAKAEAFDALKYVFGKGFERNFKFKIDGSSISIQDIILAPGGYDLGKFLTEEAAKAPAEEASVMGGEAAPADNAL